MSRATELSSINAAKATEFPQILGTPQGAGPEGASVGTAEAAVKLDTWN